MPPEVRPSRGLDDPPEAIALRGAQAPVVEATIGPSNGSAVDPWLRDALAAGGVGVWSWDLSTDLLTGDTTARRLWGLPDEGEIPFARVLASIHVDDVAAVKSASAAARMTGEDSEVVLRVLHPTGETRWMRVRGRVTGAYNDRHLVGVTLDVTERLRAEATLRTTESRLQRAQELGGAVPFEWDARADQLVAPPGFNRLYRLEPDERFNLPTFLARLHPEDRARVEDDQSRLIASPGPYETEFRIVLPDGGVRWILSRGESVRDAAGAITGIAGINLDITARKEAEDELRRARREARARFREIRALYQNAPVGLALLDRELRYVRINEKLAKIGDFTASDPVSRHIFEVMPDLREALEPSLRTVLETGEPTGNLELRCKSPSGEKAVFTCCFYPLKDEEGAISGIGVVVEDVTAHKRDAEARDLLSRELSHRIKNLFAIVSSLLTLSARGNEGVQAFAKTVRGRIEALGRAHDYARPNEWDGGVEHSRTLQSLLALLLAPYRNEAGAAERVRVHGTDPLVGPTAATALALAIHEFATNALKYGALSTSDGSIDIGCREDDELEIVWTERGGPPVAGAPERQGFGSTLARRTVSSDLGGRIETEWAQEGLVLRLRLPLERLAS